MTEEKKIRAESNAVYRLNLWFYKLTDPFSKPERRIGKIPVEEGMTVLDYGCGPGRYALPVAKLVGPKGKVFAVDIQPLAISSVKQRAAHEALSNIEAILVDSYDTGIQGSSVDMVLLLDILHQIGDCEALFREIHRVLKPNGVLFMDSGHMKMLRGKEIVETSGLFTIVECRDDDMLVAPKAGQ
ncbi:MAG: class I SAM-dependent methyltransferase [Chloroflexota bacterium]|nr:class I SAM-dependent methyltransferase [Chloroflexota bacterium]